MKSVDRNAERLLNEPTRRKEIRREHTLTIRSYGEFFERMNEVWDKKGYRNRNHWVCAILAKEMKWKEPF